MKLVFPSPLSAIIMAAFMVTPTLSIAEGFSVKDVSAVNVETSGYKGGVFEAGAVKPTRLIVTCSDCTDTVVVDIQILRSEDGTEERYRSGETTIEGMRKMCQDRNPSCTLDPIEIGDAVGWVTGYEQGSMSGSTSVLFLDSDMLIIRSIAPDIQTARDNGTVARETVGTRIISEN